MCRLHTVQGGVAEGSKSSLCSSPKGAPFSSLPSGSVQLGGSSVRKHAHTPMQMRVHLALPGYEPLTPLPPAAASVPVWQDRTIASSRLRLLEYSAFMEVQRDPDTVTCLAVGVRVCASLWFRAAAQGPGRGKPRGSRVLSAPLTPYWALPTVQQTPICAHRPDEPCLLRPAAGGRRRASDLR